MRSLFLRIFFWYWLVMAVLGLALLAVTATTQTDDGGRRQARLEEVLRFHAPIAAALHGANETRRAHEYVSGLRRVSRLRAWLFDENGKLVSGRNATPAAQRLAAQTLDAVKSGEGQTAQARAAQAQAGGEQNLLRAQAARARDGRLFVLVGERVRPGPVDVVRFRLLSRRVHPMEQALRLAVVLLTAGVLCYVLARYLTVPVVALRAAARKLASGDLSARVGAAQGRRNDELAGLARDFDMMAERLENLVLSQRRLIGDMSHELRSPLARLNVALELARLHSGREGNEALQTDLDRAERESERLNELIGQLLSLAHLESGEAHINEEMVELAVLVREVATDAAFEAHHHGRKVQVQPGDECRIQGDRELLRRAIENIVRNAIFYTAKNTEVEISLVCEKTGENEGEAIIRVRDYGPGAPEEELDKLFRPFHRVESARDRQRGGVGLGLAIAERAVRLHGGTISARNAPGGGLLVEISLPTPTA